MDKYMCNKNCGGLFGNKYKKGQEINEFEYLGLSYSLRANFSKIEAKRSSSGYSEYSSSGSSYGYVSPSYDTPSSTPSYDFGSSSSYDSGSSSSGSDSSSFGGGDFGGGGSSDSW